MKIETLEQLSELPGGTVLRDRYGDLWEKDGEFWYYAGEGYDLETLELCLPAVTLIPGVISQEQLAEMVAAFWSLETAPTPEAGMANALAVIGVSVE